MNINVLMFFVFYKKFQTGSFYFYSVDNIIVLNSKIGSDARVYLFTFRIYYREREALFTVNVLKIFYRRHRNQ